MGRSAGVWKGMGTAVASGKDWLRARAIPLVVLRGRFPSLCQRRGTGGGPATGDASTRRLGWKWKVGVLLWGICAWSVPSPHPEATAPQALVILAQPDPMVWMSMKPIAPLTTAGSGASVSTSESKEEHEMEMLEESRYFSRLPRVQSDGAEKD